MTGRSCSRRCPRVFATRDLRELGEQFEAEEHRRFGKEGFLGVVAQVAGLEATLGIADLASFTPAR